MTNMALSLSDLLLVDGFKEAYRDNNEEQIKEILFKNGMDIKAPIEQIFRTHRNLRGQVVSCLRYESFERTDKEWVKGAAASLEAIIESTNDPDYKRELRIMSKQGFEHCDNGEVGE